MPRATKPLPEGFIPLTPNATRIKCTLCHYDTTMRISGATSHIRSSSHQAALRYAARVKESKAIDDDRTWCEERFQWEERVRSEEQERQKRDEEEEAKAAKEREREILVLRGGRWMGGGGWM